MAESISQETVDQVWQGMAEMSEEDALALATTFRQEQGTLSAYLLQASSVFVQNEREIIFYIGVAAWQMMLHSDRMLGRVTKARLDKALHKNAGLVRMIAEDTDADFYNAVQTLIALYPEPEVLRYIAEALNEESDDPTDPGLRDEVKGLAFLHLKIALDALIYALMKTRA